MGNKPSTVSTWATDADTTVDPGSGKKATGFLPAEQPPAEFFNWLFNLLFQWVGYLNAPNNITLGADLVDTEAHAVTERLTVAAAANSVANYTLAFKGGDARLWVGSTTKLALVLTYNADRTTDASGKWKKITASQPATALYLSRDRIVSCSMPLAQNTDWSDAFVVGEGTASGWGRGLDIPADSEADTKAQSDVARFAQQISTTSGVLRVLQFHFKHATLGHVRCYYAQSTSDGEAGAFEITCNAGFDNTAALWANDITGTCFKLVFSRVQLGVKFKVSAAAGSTFADSAWDTAPINFLWQTTASAGSRDNRYNLGNGRLQFVGTQSGFTNDANPPAAAAGLPANGMSAKHIAKAWGYINEDHTTGPTVADGLNIASVSHNTGADTISVVFETPMQSANYDVSFGADFMVTGSVFLLPNVTARATTGFTVNFGKLPVGGAIAAANIGTDDLSFSFHVFARQDS